MKLSKKVKGKKVNAWNLATEPRKNPKTGQVTIDLRIKRWVIDEAGVGRTERYPATKYKHLLHSRDELERLVRRLNEEEFPDELKKVRTLTRMAGLVETDLERYEKAVRNRIPSDDGVKREMQILRDHVRDVFIGKLSINNPKNWYREGRDGFMDYLLNHEDAPKSSFSKKMVIQVLNRFVAWLHDERPDEVPQMIFPPIPKAKSLAIERKRVSDGDFVQRSFIPDADWGIILEALKTDMWKKLHAPVVLSKRYGLRRQEALGLTYEGTDAVWENHLSLKRQLVYWNAEKGSKFDFLKTPGRIDENNKKPDEERRIPHWHDVSAEETCDLIEMMTANMLSPDQFSKGWAALMAELREGEKIRKEYEIHELRHDWISRSRAKYASREVQLAAGHKSIETTEKYSHDMREFTEKRVRPKKGTT